MNKDLFLCILLIFILTLFNFLQTLPASQTEVFESHIYYMEDGTISVIVRPFNWLIVNDVDGTIWCVANFPSLNCSENETAIRVFSKESQGISTQCIFGSGLEIINSLSNCKRISVKLKDLVKEGKASPIHVINNLLKRGTFHTFPLK